MEDMDGKVGVFRQKQCIKKITITSFKNISENKILKWTESFGWDNTKKSLKALFSLWSLKKRKLVFIEKIKKKRF